MSCVLGPAVWNRKSFRDGLWRAVPAGTVRIDGAILAGITSRKPSLGVTAGFTWVFQAFQIP